LSAGEGSADETSGGVTRGGVTRGEVTRGEVALGEVALGEVALDKVGDEQLRSFATGGGSDRRPVLVEVALPRRQVRLGSSVRGGPQGRAPVGVEPRPGGAGDQDAATVESARAFLAGELGAEPVWLGAAGAFTAEVTGDELAAIARSPLVRAVHPNRRLG
jgi:hypothetical protein